MLYKEEGEAGEGEMEREDESINLHHQCNVTHVCAYT